MSAVNLVQNLMSGLEAGNYDQVSAIFSDDFRLNLKTPFQVGRMEILGFLGVFKNALPDLAFNFSNAREEEGKVKGTVQPSGTHSKDVILPGMPPIPATGKVINLPPFAVEFTIKDNQVSEMKIDEVQGGSFATLMQKLGLNFPGM
jgi:hypothetical protein